MLRFLFVFSATTFSSYNPDIAKKRASARGVTLQYSSSHVAQNDLDSSKNVALKPHKHKPGPLSCP